MLRRVTLIITDVLEVVSAFIISMTKIGEQRTTLAFRLLVTAKDVLSVPILVTLKMEVLSSSKTSVLIRAARRNILEDTILHSHCRVNLKSYIKSAPTISAEEYTTPARIKYSLYIQPRIHMLSNKQISYAVRWNHKSTNLHNARF
jgi:hypothetical protein